jgi:dTDP-glucose 4,6-dehydratase
METTKQYLMSETKVVITGGAGFIGSNLARFLSLHRSHWKITVLDKLSYASSMANLNGLPIEFVQGDICCPQTVAEVLEGADYCINTAAETHVDRSLVDSRPFVRSNVEGVLVLLEGCRAKNVHRMLQVSTDEVYGDLPLDSECSMESDPFAPRSPYAATKAGAELLARSYHVSHGLDVVFTRGSNTYGPYQCPEKVIPFFATQALGGLNLPLYGDGSALRDYLHVEDHCRGILRVLEHGESGEAYNLGADLQISGKELAQQVAKHFQLSPDRISFIEDRPGHDYRYHVSSQKTVLLGWKREWTFEHGLKSTLQWYQNNSDWWEEMRARPELEEHFKIRYGDEV